MPLTVVSTSLATVAIDTFMTDVSRVITNWPAASVARTMPPPVAAARAVVVESVMTAPLPGGAGSGQRLRLELLELRVADDALGLEIGEPLELVGRAAARPRHRLHVLLELLVGLLLLGRGALRHRPTARDQVDEHPEER